MSSKLFVGSLAWATSDESLKAHFDEYGEVVEAGSTSELFASPQHDYTQSLLAAVPGKAWQEGVFTN